LLLCGFFFNRTQNEQSPFCYANAEFSSAEGSRALRSLIGRKMSKAHFTTLTLSFPRREALVLCALSLLDAKQTSSFDYANAEFPSAGSPRALRSYIALLEVRF